jgi:hypothetical protein
MKKRERRGRGRVIERIIKRWERKAGETGKNIKIGKT